MHTIAWTCSFNFAKVNPRLFTGGKLQHNMSLVYTLFYRRGPLSPIGKGNWSSLFKISFLCWVFLELQIELKSLQYTNKELWVTSCENASIFIFLAFCKPKNYFLHFRSELRLLITSTSHGLAASRPPPSQTWRKRSHNFPQHHDDEPPFIVCFTLCCCSEQHSLSLSLNVHWWKTSDKTFRSASRTSNVNKKERSASRLRPRK